MFDCHIFSLFCGKFAQLSISGADFGGVTCYNPLEAAQYFANFEKQNLVGANGSVCGAKILVGMVIRGLL